MSKILLTYSPEKVSEPVLASVIKETGLLLNVLHAKINSSGGHIIVSVEAPEEKIKMLLEVFRSKGVTAKEMKEAITLDRDSCTDCGACISLCPTGALYFTRERRVEIDEKRCVYCRLCVEACPVRALLISPG